MVPFLDTVLHITHSQPISLILRRKAVTDLLMKVDLEKKETLVHVKNVELGSASVLAKLSVKDEVKVRVQKGCDSIIQNY